MDQAAFIQAILIDPDDDLTRLAFADWLEENGHEARGAWIRVSCELAKVHSSDPGWADLLHRERECFRECRPEWWQSITGVGARNDRGTFRFEVRSKTATARLGKVGWLGDALAGGWLDTIAITWSDDSLARVVGAWKGAAREVPLFVRPGPQIGDEGLGIYLAMPHLWGLDLPGHATRNRSVLGLGRRSDLRELTLDGLPAEDMIAAVFEQVGRLGGLRRLTIGGWSNQRPLDPHLRSLDGLPELRELRLDACFGLTDAGLTSLRSLTGLRRLELSRCKGISDAGVADLQTALPALAIERR